MAETLKGEESHALAEVEIFVGKQVKVQIEPLYNRGAVRRRHDVNRVVAPAHVGRIRRKRRHPAIFTQGV